MTNLKTVLLAATAVTLAAGVATAGDNNKVFITQQNNSNDALITQSGSDNEAGATSPRILQQGNGNDLTILQSGDNNTIGTGAGVLQSAGPTGNVMSLTQSSDNNDVKRAQQSGGGNQLTVIQRDTDTANGGTAGNFFSNGIVQSVEVGGAQGSTATLIQDGNGNEFGLVWQKSTGIRNVIDDLVTGKGNVGGHHQFGADQNAFVRVTGDGNRFSTDQDAGYGTDADGNNNDIELRITGSLNNVDSRQYSDRNNAVVNIATGDSNLVKVWQQGVYGATSTTNETLVDISGSANVLDISQTAGSIGTAQNGVDIDIFGDDNNATAFTASIITGLLPAGLAAGDIVQNGRGNTVDLDIGTALVASSDNLFAVKQAGGSNSVTGDITGGSNQALVLQNGNSNGTSFTQAGTGNTLAVTQ